MPSLHQTHMLNLVQFKDVCIGVKQTVGTGPIGGFNYGEDCLYISVITPSSATNTSHLPVLFHIPGGGFAQLADPNLDFTDFVKTSGNNIVAVQINYRVGGLGFLAGEEVRSGGALNAGLLDQRKALQWVRKYISQVRSLLNSLPSFNSLTCTVRWRSKSRHDLRRLCWRWIRWTSDDCIWRQR